MHSAPVRLRGLSHQLTEQLGLAIAAGKLEPGAVINPDELAAQHGVSRGTVREALAMLAAVNMVAIRHGRETSVMAPEQRNLLDPKVLAWHAEVGALDADAADLAARLPALAALLPGNQLVAALARTLGAGEMDTFLIPLRGSDAFPVSAAFCVPPGSFTPLAEFDAGDEPDHPEVLRDLDGRPHLRVTVHGTTVYDNPVPQPVADEHGVHLPARRWIQQRVGDCYHMPTMLVNLHLDGCTDAAEAARSVAAWASDRGSRDVLILPAGGPHDALDQTVHIVLLPSSGANGGPVAVVITETAGHDDQAPFHVAVYRDRADAADWQVRDQWQAVCENDHVIRHRAGHATDTGAGTRTRDAQAWPAGMTVPDGGGGFAVPCTRCGALSYPEMVEL